MLLGQKHPFSDQIKPSPTCSYRRAEADSESQLLVVKTILQVLAVPNRNPETQLELAELLRDNLRGQKVLLKDKPLSHFLDLLMEVNYSALSFEA